MKSLLGLGLVMLLASCGKGGGGGSHSNPLISEPEVEASSPEVNTPYETPEATILIKRKVELESDFSNFDAFKHNINTYSIQFEAKTKSFMNAQVECQRKGFDQRKTTFLGEFNLAGHIAEVEIKIESHDTAENSYLCQIAAGEKVLFKKEIKLLKSYVIKETKDFQTFINAPKIASLVIDSNAILLTSGKTVELEADEIISPNGKMMTFSEEEASKAISNRPGLSGGKIVLKTKRVLGSLSFELRGMNAGEHTLFPDAIQAVPAADPSLNGNCRTALGRDGFRYNGACAGKKGHQGFKGEKGFPGFQGGDSGSLELSILDETDGSIEVKYFPGKGSVGGKGGLGGLGGPGGKGLIVSWTDLPDHHGCARCSQLKNSFRANRYVYPDGAQGDKGLPGDQGESGQDGEKIESVLTIGSNKNVMTNDFKI